MISRWAPKQVDEYTNDLHSHSPFLCALQEDCDVAFDVRVTEYPVDAGSLVWIVTEHGFDQQRQLVTVLLRHGWHLGMEQVTVTNLPSCSYGPGLVDMSGQVPVQ